MKKKKKKPYLKSIAVDSLFMMSLSLVTYVSMFVKTTLSD